MPRLTFLFILASLLFVACAAEGDDVDDDLESEDIGEATSDVIAGGGRRVCGWNVRRLGNNFENQPKDIDAVATVIRDNCDIVALTEVMVTISQSGTNTGGFDALMAKLGTRYWGGTITSQPVPNPPTSNSEYYAFIYRKSAAAPCNGFATPRYMKDPQDVFIREPAYACFKVNASSKELVLGAYHALFGSPIERRREVSFLDDDLDRNGKPDDLFAAMKASRSGSPDVLLLGDFNLTPSELKDALPRYVDLTVGTGSTINSKNEITSNLYDHAVVPADSRLLKAGTKPARTLDVRRVAKKNTTFYTSVSDHLPIRIIIE
ncbi:MAG: hypothetical protein KIT84_03570 [Labilithrix sp.]|nr:hypothetical protein [Labilithrix sp.]MCW5810062.1 hypothetical protein [Labilithrix sp.]